MRKTLLAAVLLVAVAALLLVSGTGSIARADGGPAIVIKNASNCGMPGSDASGNLIFGGIGTVTTEVQNGNKVMIKCMGNPIENDSGQGQNFDGFACGIVAPDGNFYVTTDSHATVSASGVGTLTCTFKFA